MKTFIFRFCCENIQRFLKDVRKVLHIISEHPFQDLFGIEYCISLLVPQSKKFIKLFCAATRNSVSYEKIKTINVCKPKIWSQLERRKRIPLGKS